MKSVSSPSIVVVGSVNIDLVATAPRIPSPGQTVIGDGFFNRLQIELHLLKHVTDRWIRPDLLLDIQFLRQQFATLLGCAGSMLGQRRFPGNQQWITEKNLIVADVIVLIRHYQRKKTLFGRQIDRQR